MTRAQSFGASRAIGIALRAQAVVGPSELRLEGLSKALAVLAASPARLEHARVLVDIGATLRAAGQRTAAREPLFAIWRNIPNIVPIGNLADEASSASSGA